MLLICYFCYACWYDLEDILYSILQIWIMLVTWHWYRMHFCKAQENRPPATTLENKVQEEVNDFKYLGSYIIQNISWQEKGSYGILVTNCDTYRNLTSQKIWKSASPVPMLKKHFTMQMLKMDYKQRTGVEVCWNIYFCPYRSQTLTGNSIVRCRGSAKVYHPYHRLWNLSGWDLQDTATEQRIKSSRNLFYGSYQHRTIE